MVDSVRQCRLSNKVMIPLNNFLYIFNLRQGTILIAVHQIALSSFILIILLVGISHVGDMLSMLHNDMEDDAERRGYYAYGEQFIYHQGQIVSTNQRRFAKAQHLASVTVIFLYTSTILTSIYLMCCVSLLHGAVKSKREYVVPWIMASCVGEVLLIVAIFIGDGYPCLVNVFGGHNYYHIGCALFVGCYLYAIFAVCSFALEAGTRCARAARALSDERGERVMLIDHVAHSSMLSTAQLNKLNRGTRSQFV